MMLMFAVAAAAPLDPLLVGAGLPEDADVRIDRGDPMWTVTIEGRPVLVPTPRTPADEDVVRALVISLLSGLDLVPTAPLPPLTPPPPSLPPVVRTERPPEPPPPAAPPVVVMFLPVVTAPPVVAEPAPTPVVAPSVAAPPVVEAPVVTSAPTLRSGPPLAGWAAAEVVMRPGMSPGAGGAAGIWVGRRGGVGLRLAGVLPRAASVGGPSSVLEVDTDVEVWGSVLPALSWVVAGGAAVRRYGVGDQEVAMTAIPHASAGVLVPVQTEMATLAFGAALELDLGTTRIGPVGGRELLPPAGLRIELRVAGRN